MRHLQLDIAAGLGQNSEFVLIRRNHRVSQLVRAKITALGTYVPPRLLTNDDLEKLVETSNDWIVERTGIRERHVVDKGVATSDLATAAAKQALIERGLAPSDLDALIVATVTPDMFFPSTACLVQNKLGAQGIWGFDLSAACSAFLYALQTGAQFIATGVHKKVMVIGADVMSSIIDYTDRATCVIFGDGAGAVLLEAAENDSEGLIDFIHEVDGSGGCSLYMPGGGSLHPSTHETVDKRMHFVHQDGQAVFKFAVRKQAELCEKILTRNGLKGTDIDTFIPHQANRRIITATADRLGLRPESLIINIDRFGNTTAGTIPLAMATARQEGKLKKGNLVLLASVGAGFTVGVTLLRWAY
jgi:3-oxoacyl-[acyl-carrier-protein] synthase III